MTYHVRLNRAVLLPVRHPLPRGIAAAGVIELAVKTDSAAMAATSFDSRMNNLLNLTAEEEQAAALQSNGAASRSGGKVGRKGTNSATTNVISTKSTAKKGKKLLAQAAGSLVGEPGAINNGARFIELSTISAKNNFLLLKRPKKLPSIAVTQSQYFAARDVLGEGLVAFSPELVSYGPGIFI
jgi:hypothetical protein